VSDYDIDGLRAALPSARSHANLPFQNPRVDIVPDSDNLGVAVEGIYRPSTSGKPDPDTSI